MRSILISAALFLLVAGPQMQESHADIDIGLSAGDEGLKGFYLAIGEHYKVPEKEMIKVRQRSVPDEELAVVFLLAGRAAVSPEMIVDLRLKGESWMAITLHFGLSADIFYVPLRAKPGPPFGKAYGHFKNKPKKRWNEIRLPDSDVVNMVNVKFISERYGHSPDDVIKMRQQGRSFVNINAEIKKKIHQKKKEDPPKNRPSKSNDKGKKAKGKDK